MAPPTPIPIPMMTPADSPPLLSPDFLANGGVVGGGVICESESEPEPGDSVCEAPDALEPAAVFVAELITTIAGLVSQPRLVTPARTSV